MRSLHILHRALLLLLLAVGQVCAQQADSAGKAVELADRLEAWRQSQDIEEKIALGEELVAREGELATWPLSEPRERVRAELRFVVGSAYAVRPRGVRADNLESAIGHLKAVLGIWTREADTQDWARLHNNIGIAYWWRIRGERADNQEEAIAHLRGRADGLHPRGRCTRVGAGAEQSRHRLLEQDPRRARRQPGAGDRPVRGRLDGLHARGGAQPVGAGAE